MKKQQKHDKHTKKTPAPRTLDEKQLVRIQGGVGWGDGNGCNAYDDWEAPIV